MFTSRGAVLATVAIVAAALVGCESPSPQPSGSIGASTDPSVDQSADASATAAGDVACVGFEDLPLGSQIGTPSGLVSGDLAFTDGGIPVSVLHFEWTSGPGTLGFAEVTAATPVFGDGQFVFMNNINFDFDFTALGFAVTRVDLRFRDQGGNENLSVNDDPTPPLADDISAMPATLGGVSVVISPVNAEGVGSAEFTGPIQRLVIGGQEFSLDNVCAYAS